MPDVNDDLKAMREFSRGDQKIFEKVWKMPGFKEALLKKGVLNGEEVREVIREFAFPDDVIGSKGCGSDGGGSDGGGTEGGGTEGGSTGACVSAFVISMFCTLAVIALFAGIIKVMKVHRRREERDKKRWWARNKLGG